MASTPALPGEDDEPIFSLAEDCEALFQQEISGLEFEQSEELRLLEEHQQRFTAWTAYMGVFAKRSLCLDRKLRHHPDLQDLVLRLLDILKTNLSYRILPPPGINHVPVLNTQNTPEPKLSEESSAKDEAEPSPQAVDKDALEAINGAIDRLNRLGVAIRQSSTRRLTARGTTKVSGFHSFKELATLFVKTTYPGATYELQDQLGKSMAERFDSVISSQSQHAARGERRHKTTNTLQSIAEDMELDEAPPADVPIPEEAPAMNEAQYQRMMTERTGQFSSLQRRHDARGRRSEASMSSIDRQVLQQKMSGQSNIGSQEKKKKETSSIQINQVGYPKAPQVKNYSNRITCEWCFETKEQKFFEGDEWRKHVDNDLKPYLCISEKCAEPICSFTTLNSWKEHMLAQHGMMWHQDVHLQETWVCAVCHEPSEGFQNPQALYSHMENAHHFTEAQLEAIVTQSKVQGRRRPDICPLCFLHVEKDPGIASKSYTARGLVSTDAGKRRQHEPPVPESTPKRVRTGGDVGQTSPREPEAAAKARSNDELTEAGDRNSSHIDLMARHVAAHLQGLMFLTIRLMSLHNNDSKSVSIASSSADSGDASTRKMTSPSNSEPGAESPMRISDQELIEDRDESEDGADDIPDSKSDPDWSRVIQSNKQLEGPEALGGLLHLSHPDDRDLALIEYHFPIATKTVQIHLARSTTIRRRRLLDQRLAIDRCRPTSIQAFVPMLAKLDTGDEPFNGTSTRRPSRQMELVPGTTGSYNRTNPIYTSATCIDSGSECSSVIPLSLKVKLDNVIYPQPVRVSEKGTDHVFCQYCGRTFPSSLLLNSSWWRSHITEDVQPYICLFSRCSFLSFSEYREWAAHMGSVHSPSWYRQLSGFACPLQAECHTDGKTIPHFEDPEAFARHIETNHKAYVEAAFKSTAGAVEAWSQPESCCPLCKDSSVLLVDKLRDPARRMARHIGNHLKSTAFRLRLLPYGDDETDDADSTKMETDRNLRINDLDLDDMSLNFDSDPENPERSEELLNDVDWDEVTSRYDSIYTDRSYTDRSYTDPVLQSLRDRQAAVQSGSRGENELPIQTPTLADLIVGSYAIGVFDNPPRAFLPHSFLSEFITEAAVAEELEENLDIDNDSDLVNFIVESAKKVFATAIISAIDGSNLYMLMKRFQEKKFDDRCLPLKRDTMLALPCFQGKFWNKLRTHNFLRNQWVFLTPVFSKSQFKIFELEPEHVFPFTWVSNDAKKGTFNNVYQVTIHESHQEDPTWTVEGRRANVAIKEIKGGMDPPSIDKEYELHKKWVAEARALDHIRGLNHRNIIQRIAAIKRGKEHYFMFEWADGGSLRDFWKDNPRPNLDSGFIKEIVIQLRELADALHELHNYEGSFRHGDLKPENILRFKDATRVGVLKIADMGSVRHHTDLSYTRYGTVRYEPPEVVTHRTSEESSSRLYDIWSMGCITLEFIVWLLYGYHDLMKFNDSIKSFVGGSSPYSKVGNDNVAEVHPVVRACMDDISKDPECTSNGGNIAIRDLLDIVKTNLLVVHLPQHRVSHLASIPGNVAVTDTDSRASSTYPPIRPTRATALHFRTLLDGMIGKGKEDERYWFSGISRENLKGLPTRMIPSIDLHDFLSPESASRPRAKFSEL